ncbi:MAG TPA: integrase core domain-containing protein, partial [Aminobacteriaceae bacterium]|nr:integrase core domain-containing protein [Aminobacteriaceae bacterium]
ARKSMGRVGSCYDNARMESFFATLKKEKLYRLDTLTMSVSDVRSVIYRYIAYYNLRRIYSANGGYPPMVYRRMYYTGLLAA